MKRILFTLFAVVALTASLWPVSARQLAFQSSGQKPKAAVQQLPPEEVIKRFTARESELRDVWKNYQYIQESKMQVLGPANVVSGEFYQVSEFVFNDAGKRLERILKAPPNTMGDAGVRMSQEDRDALVNLQPFALTKEDLPNYNVTYFGKEKVDDLNTYVFDVTPKVLSNPRELDRMRKQKMDGKFFQGRIWVDDEDLQIVKTAGKVVPEFEQRFPKFETYRENIDGRYWFPTYTYGDDYLEFDRFRPHVRVVVKYKNYRQFSSDVRLIDAEEIKDEKSKPEEKSQSKDPKPGEVKKGETKKEETDKTKPQRPRP